MKKQQIIKKYLIAKGNSTLLAWNCPRKQRSFIVSKYLYQVEQIGFVNEYNLEMMGSELCINGTIALASNLGAKGQIKTSGLNTIVQFINSNGVTTIKVKMKYRKINNIILFPGIGFMCIENPFKNMKSMCEFLSIRYKLPAFGIALFKKNQLTPYVYVSKIKSWTKESACGSGSIATGIYWGIKNIIQPTGETISVEISGNNFMVSARVKEVSFE